MFYIKMTILNDFPLDDEPVSQTVQFKQSLDSFYVTDSPLSVTNNNNNNILMLLP